MKMERIVKTYYDGLEEGVIYARRCLECGAIEFPPHYACNTCGYHETEWTSISGNGEMQSIILPGTMTVRPEFEPYGKYCFSCVKLEEGPEINAVVLGISPKKARTLKEKLPLPVKARILQMNGYKTIAFELTESE